MLSVTDLTCSYGDVKVLHDLHFTVDAHAKLFIVGENGCGKTTLLKAIAGLIPYTGTVALEGKDVAGWSRKERAQKVALLSQSSSVYFSYTVYETVMQGRYVHLGDGIFKSVRKVDEEMVLHCLETTGLLALRDQPIQALSGGQLQRVFLARVLAQAPAVILLDEPTNHLDLKYQLELMAYLDEWAKKDQRLVVGVVHDLNLALSFADEVLMLKAGKILTKEKSEALNLALLNQTFDVDVTGYMQQSLKRWGEKRNLRR